MGITVGLPTEGKPQTIHTGKFICLSVYVNVESYEVRGTVAIYRRGKYLEGRIYIDSSYVGKIQHLHGRRVRVVVYVV